MASLKQTTYLKEQYPEATSDIFYIDMRTPGRYEKFYWKVRDMEGVSFTKGKVARVENAPNDDVTVTLEDVMGGKRVQRTFDMVVLAAGMEAATRQTPLPLDINYTDEGMIIPSSLKPGIYAVGSAKSPVDVAKSVQDATGAALKSIQSSLLSAGGRK